MQLGLKSYSDKIDYVYIDNIINGLLIDVWLSKQLADGTSSRYPQTVSLSVCGNV